MKTTVETLTEQFTALIGPEAFAKAEAAIAAAKAAEAAAAAAKAEAAAKAAAAAAAAKAAAAAAPTAAPSATLAPAPGVASPAAPTTVAAPRPVPSAPRPATPAAAATPAIAATPKPAAPAAAAPRPATPAPAAAPAAPLPTLPVQTLSHAAKGYHFDAVVAREQIVAAVQLMDRAGFALDTITGVDWITQQEMEVVYDFFHPLEATRAVIRTRTPRGNPEVPSITAIFPGANWHEREAHDFFGIRFAGHPNLKPFLLPEDADFHPLRKDYQP